MVYIKAYIFSHFYSQYVVLLTMVPCKSNISIAFFLGSFFLLITGEVRSGRYLYYYCYLLTTTTVTASTRAASTKRTTTTTTSTATTTTIAAS